MKFSEHPDQLKGDRVAYINTRWKELADLERDAGATAATYLMVTNSGGAVAVLSFMGAMKSTTPFVNAPAMLLSFVLGIVFVGLGRALAYYRLAVRYRRWRDGVKRFYSDEMTWRALLDHDEEMGWKSIPGEIVAWAAFLSFLTGLWLGMRSLP